MEGFEHVCKVALEADNFVVATNLKFPVKRQTSKKTLEIQEHGYEVDLVGARRDKLVLASVKSYFGSQGISRHGFRGLSEESKYWKQHSLFNFPDIQEGIIKKACEMFGYDQEHVELRLYVGKFKSIADQEAIKRELSTPKEGLRSVEVIDIESIVQKLHQVCESKTYRNDPVVMTIKALNACGD